MAARCRRTLNTQSALEPTDDDALLGGLVAAGRGKNGGVDLPIPDDLVFRILRLIDTSDICEHLNQWRAQDRANQHPGGRPALFDDRTVLAACLLLAVEHTPLLASRMADVVHHRLSPDALLALGATRSTAPENDRYAAMWRAVHRMLAPIDTKPISRYRRTNPEEYAAELAKLDPAQIVERQQRCDWFCNELLQLSWRLLPRRARRWKGNSAIDATVVEVPYRRNTAGETTDHQAGWYKRDGDHNGSNGSGGRHSKLMYSYEATLVINVANKPGASGEFPLLVSGISFGAPGRDVAGQAMTALGQMNDRQMPVGYLIGDRAYVPGQKFEKLQLPVRAFGHKPVADYPINQLGIQEGYAGAILVEGTWYCPSMPQPLIDACIDYNADLIDLDTRNLRIEQRRRYALRPKELVDEHGHQPLRCPAAGSAATVACPLKASSLRGTDLTLRARVTPPAHPDRICTNKTSVSFPPSAGAKYRQDLAYKTKEWQQIYSLRNTVEGFNGYVKDPNREALGDPGRRRIRGYAAQYVFTTILVVSANIRKIRAWIAKNPLIEATAPRRARRSKARRERLSDYMPLANSPPAA
jgi:hypothetical protein